MAGVNKTSGGLRFTRLKLSNWRNFASVDIALAPRVFFVGPNASGKSNLLKAFRFLHDVVADNGGFQEAVRREGGVGSLRCLAARTIPNLSIEVSLGTDEEATLWKYKLSFRDDKRTKDPLVVSETVWHGGEKLIERPKPEEKADPTRLRYTELEQPSVNKEFREVADFFSTIRYSHVVPQVVREPSRSSGHDDPYGGDLLERVNSTAKKTREARLKVLSRALAVAVPQLSNLELVTDAKGIPHFKAKYNHWRPQGAWQTEERFSDGTIRLLGFLWTLQEKGGPLLLEEPELSLHQEVTRQIPGMIGRAQRKSGRQAIITTHSSALLDYEGIGLDEVHLLEPSENGTRVTSGADIADVRALVDAGIPVGEAIIPKAQPKGADKLTTMDI
jgi:predicted ATPase